MGRDILKRIAAETVVAIGCRGDEWPRGLLAGTPIPDGWMALLERRDGRRRLVPAGDEPRAEPGDALTLVRNRALVVPLSVADAGAAGGHDVNGRVEVLVRAPARDHEIAALGRALVNGRELQIGALAERVAAAGGRAALRSYIASQSAEHLVSADQRPQVLAYLTEKLRDFLFESGLEIERVAVAEFQSASHAREQARRREAAASVATIEARELVEQAAVAATHRKLDDLSGVFSKLRATVADGGEGAWQDLLPALSPTERGRLLKNLWRLTPDELTAQAVVAIAGNQVVWLDPATPQTPQRSITLPDELGPLRSVTFRSALGLLVGAASGIWRLQAQTGEVLGQFATRTPTRVTTGFNGVAVFGAWVVGTHSQLGAWAWRWADAAAQPSILVDPKSQPATTIRGATVTSNGRLLIAVDDALRGFNAELAPVEGFEPAGGAIHAVAACGEHVYVATDNGRVLRDRLDGTQGMWEVVHREPGAIESLHARRWHDLTELVIAAGARGALGVYPDQDVVTPLLEAPMPVRRTWVCDDAIVALSELRDRLYILHAPTAALPVDVPLSRRLSASIQDACIVTANLSPTGVRGDIVGDRPRA